MRYLALIAALVGWLISAGETQAYYLDTPHNESNGIVCFTCHGMAGLSAPDADGNGLPDWTWADRALANPEDTAHNYICNACHSKTPLPGLPKGPEKVMHSKVTTGSTKPNWTTECVQCHDVHYQGQLDYSADDFAKLYLVTGTFTSNPTYANPTPAVAGSDSTSINFTTTTTQPGFEDTSKWKSKGGASSGSANMVATRAVDGSRGLILVPDKTNHPETFEIIDVTANTITVKGRMVRDAIPSGNFAIIYGQSIKSSVMPNGGLVANDLRDVKYFAPKLSTGTYGGHVDLTTGSTKPLGLCQVCHAAPSAWPKTGGPASHYPTTDCDSCHNILNGGGAPLLANTGGPYLVEQGSGVTLIGGADFATPCIDGESTQWDLDNNGTYDVAGPGFVGGRVDLTWAQLGTYGLQTIGVPHTITLQALNTCDGAQATATTTLTVYDNTPVANFTATPNPATCGQSITFDASTSSHSKPGQGIISYAWDYGDGATGTGVTASHAYSGSGAYAATLTVTDDNLPAKTATTAATVNVNQCNSAPLANAGLDQSVTTGALVTLNGGGSADADGDQLSYGWSFTSRPFGSSAVLAGANTASPTFMADVAGSYVVSLLVNDGRVDSVADMVTITVNPPPLLPTISLSANPAAFFLGSGQDSARLSWSTTNAQHLYLQRLNSGQAEFEVFGSYYDATSINATTTFAARAVSTTGAAVTTSVTVKVLDQNALGIAIISPLAGATIPRTFSRVEGLVTNGGAEVGVTVNGIPAQVAFNTFFVNNLTLAEGENTITAVVTKANGDTDTSSITVTSNPTGQEWLELTLNPESGVADPNAIPPQPFTATLTVTPHLAGSLVNWSWSFGYSYLGYGTNPNPMTYTGNGLELQLSFSEPGIYTLNYTIYDNDTGQSYPGEIMVNVQDKVELDSALRQKWEHVKTAWTAHNVEGGLAYFAEASQANYRGALTALDAELPQIVSEMQEIELIYTRGRYAKYRLNRHQDINGTMVDMTYYLYFVKDHSGLWKVDQF